MSIYVEGRTTAAGTEYWNKDLKRVELFKPGTKPDNIQTEGLVGQYSLGGKTASDMEPGVPEYEINLDEMDADELRAFAEQNNIDVPGNMKKAETIRDHIVAELNG